MTKTDVVRLVLVPIWLIMVVVATSALLKTEFGVAFVGLFMFVMPLGTFILWPTRRVHQAAKKRDAAIAARAEWENTAYLHGDLRGLFGQYPPK